MVKYPKSNIFINNETTNKYLLTDRDGASHGTLEGVSTYSFSLPYSYLTDPKYPCTYTLTDSKTGEHITFSLDQNGDLLHYTTYTGIRAYIGSGNIKYIPIQRNTGSRSPITFVEQIWHPTNHTLTITLAYYIIVPSTP